MDKSLTSFCPFAAVPFETFQRRFPTAVLVLEEVGVVSDSTGSYTLGVGSGVFRTGDPEVLVIVGKSPRAHPLRGWVTLGRSVRNDLEVKSEGISKFHCYLRQEGLDWVVLDARSRNGTRVNGDRLGPAEQRLLRDGDALGLGESAILTYYSPRGLYQRIQGAVRCG